MKTIGFKHIAPFSLLLTLLLYYPLMVRFRGPDQIQLSSDQVQLIRKAERVLNGVFIKTGHSSVSGPDHPGPLYIYLLALVLLLCGSGIECLFLVTSFIKCGTVFLMSLLAFRLSRSFMISISVPLLLLANPTFLTYAKAIWGPAIIFPFFVASVWLTLEICMGRIRLLMLWTFTGSFMMQAHVSQIPVFLCESLFIIAHLFRREFRSGIQGEFIFKNVIISVLVFLVLWWPPLYDALLNDGGNLKRLAVLHMGAFKAHAAGEIWVALLSLFSGALPAKSALCRPEIS